MADTIKKGMTFVFKGETAEFNEAVNKISKGLDGVKKESIQLNKELKVDPSNIEKLTAKFENLKKEQKLLNEQIKNYETAMKKMDKNSEEFKKAEYEVRNLKVSLQYCNQQLDKIGNNRVSLSLNNLSKGFKDIGGKVEELGKKFSVLSGVASGLLASFGKLAYDTVKYADDINTLAKQTGLGTDTLQAFGQMADLIDVDLNTLSKSAIYLTKNLDNKTALETYKKLGVAIKDSTGNYRETESILFDTLTALQKVEDETERSMLASDLFGKSYSNLGAILNDASVDLAEVTNMVRENGAVLSTEQLTALNDVNDSIDTMKMKFGGLGTQLVAEFEPQISTVMNTITQLADKFISFVNSLSTEQKEKILKVITIVASIAPILITVGTALSLVASTISNVSTVLGFLTNGFSMLSAFLTTNPFGALVTVFGVIIGLLVTAYNKSDTFRSEVNKLATYLSGAFTNTINFVRDTFVSAMEMISNAISTVVGWLKSAFEWVSNLLNAVKDLFASGFSKVGSIIGGWFSSGGFGNIGAYASGGYGTLELQTTININNNGANISEGTAQLFGKQIVDYVNNKLGRRL